MTKARRTGRKEEENSRGMKRKENVRTDERRQEKE